MEGINVCNRIVGSCNNWVPKDKEKAVKMNEQGDLGVKLKKKVHAARALNEEKG